MSHDNNGQDVTQQFLLVGCSSLIIVGAILLVALARRSLRASDPHVLMRNKVSLLFGVPAGVFTFVFFALLLIPRQLAPISGGTQPSPSALPALATSLLAVVAFAIYMTIISTVGTMLGLTQASPDISHMRRLSRAFDKALGLLTRLIRPTRGDTGAA